MISSDRIRAVSLKMLKPYSISTDSPYLSEDQCKLSTLTITQRAAWMAEWLYLANNYKEVSHKISHTRKKV